MMFSGMGAREPGLLLHGAVDAQIDAPRADVGLVAAGEGAGDLPQVVLVVGGPGGEKLGQGDGAELGVAALAGEGVGVQAHAGEGVQISAKGGTSADNLNADVKRLPFERALEELETIVKRLEEGKVPLEESVAIYERGEVLKRRCEELLRQAEARVEKITLDASGKPAGSEPLDVD